MNIYERRYKADPRIPRCGSESLGGVESLLTYPYSQTHAETPCELKDKVGLDDCLLRLSVGIEDVSDLIEDLSQALESCAEANEGGLVL